MVDDQGRVVQVFINHLQKLLDDGRIQPSVVRDMGAALRELYALGITVSASAGGELLNQAAGRGEFLTKHLPSSITKNVCDNGALLIRAASNNQVEVLQLLLNDGTDRTPFVLSTALEFAACNNSIEAIQLLLKHEACASLFSRDNSFKVLEAAGRKGHVTMAKLLMPQINTKRVVSSSWHYRALMVTAATCGFPEIIRWVLKNKPSCSNNKARSDRLLINSHSPSLLLRAIDGGHKNTIALLMELLLEKGVNLNQRTAYVFLGRPLFYKGTDFMSPRIIAIVRPGSAYVKDMFKDAVRRDDSVTVNYLMERGYDPDTIWRRRISYCDYENTTSLGLAAEASDPNATEATLAVLLYHGADMSKASPSKWSPTDANHLAIVRALVGHGADPTPERNEWASASLSKATNYRTPHIKTTQFLLQNRASRLTNFKNFWNP